MNRRGFLKSLAAFGIANAIPVKAIAAVAAQADIMPAGTIMQFLKADRTAVHAILSDDGWIPCDGRSLSREAYPALYAMLLNNYSAGGHDPATFDLPDLRWKPGRQWGTVWSES